MNKVFGVDLSKWQGMSFNFQKLVDLGCSFVIIRGGSGVTKDTCFERFYRQAKKVGLSVGTYYYCLDKSENAARCSAKWFYENCLKGKQFDYPIFYDVEDSSLCELTKEKLTSIAMTWCDWLEDKNYFVGIYANTDFFNNRFNDDKLCVYTHWVASWQRNKPTLKSGNKVGIWQFGGETNKLRSNKINNVIVDQDYSYCDYATIIKRLGFNGYKQTNH